MGQVKRDIRQLGKESGGMGMPDQMLKAGLKILRNLSEKQQYRKQREDLDQDKSMYLDMMNLNMLQNGIEIHVF